MLFRSRLEQPRRLEHPVVESRTSSVTQPYMTVLRRDEGWRLWFNSRSEIRLADSSDGVHWRNFRTVWKLRHAFGAGLVDDAPGASDPTRRYKLADWQATPEKEDKPGDDGGMAVGFSSDGERWRPYEKNPVLRTWPQDWPTMARDGVGDTIDVHRDDLLGQIGRAHV